MAKDNRVSFFNPKDDFAGGGTFFNDGLYHNESFRFTRYNFGDDSKSAACCLCGKMTPVDAQGNATGEQVIQYWPVNVQGKDEFVPTKDGTGLMAGPDAEHDKPWGGSAFAIFMKQLQKAWPDVEQFDNDITVMDDKVMEFGKVNKEERAGSKKATDDDGEGQARNKGPKQIIVVTNVPKQGKSKPPAGGGKKDAPTGKKEPKGGSSDPEEILAEYLGEKLDSLESPQSKITFRMGMMTALGKKGVDAETCRAVASVFNDADKLGGFLTACGWHLSKDGKELQKDE